MTSSGDDARPSADVRLCLSPGVSLRAQGNGECRIVAAEGVLYTGPHALSVLGAFVVPRTMNEALVLLEPGLSAPRAAIELMNVMLELYRVGAIRPEHGGVAFAGGSRSEAYGAVPIHVGMLNDRARTKAWLEAVRRTVRPGDVVVDLGTGTGILAVAAARAGARRVYAIEASAAANAARAMVAANGVADRVEVIRGWSTLIDLPERADVLVAELLDDDPFREGLLEITGDALRRLLVPEPRLVPSRVRLSAVLVEASPDDLREYTFTAEGAQSWSELYGEDFGALLELEGPGTQLAVTSREAAAWRRLGAATTVVDFDLLAAPDVVDVEVTLETTTAGLCSGVVTWFDAQVAPELVVTTEPGRADPSNHWRNPVLLVPHPQRVEPGARYTLRYRYPGTPELELTAPT